MQRLALHVAAMATLAVLLDRRCQKCRTLPGVDGKQDIQFMPPANRTGDPIQTLSDLIRGGLEQKGWSVDTAAAEAKRRKLAGLGARNLRNYLAGRVKRTPTKRIILRFAKLFNAHEDSWLSHFPDFGIDLLLDKDAVIRDQSQLQEGDEVIVISSRAFLEADDPEVVDVVLQNLDRGITYKYYFPSGPSNPYTDVAAASYKRFRELNVGRYGFTMPPLIFGYSIKPSIFRYFSGLHTVVRFASRLPGVSKTYVYIELSQGASGHPVQAWYLLPENTARAIEQNLNEARISIADDELPILPLNRCLNRVRGDYVKWFQRDESVARYKDLRPVLGHSGDRCVRSLKSEIARMPRAEKAIRYLDIGCGDGAITYEVAQYMAQQSEVAVTTVGLDTSAAQLRSASAAFTQARDITFRAHDGTFETFDEREPYHLVTAIHSWYAIDEAYVRRIYELLEPGGIACIWLAMRQDNVVTAVCDAVDSVLRPEQRRNAAEDVVKYAKGAGLSPKMTASAGTVTPLLDAQDSPTDNGRKLINFCALQDLERGTPAWEAATKALRSSRRTGRGDHPLTDGLLVIQRR